VRQGLVELEVGDGVGLQPTAVKEGEEALRKTFTKWGELSSHKRAMIAIGMGFARTVAQGPLDLESSGTGLPTQPVDSADEKPGDTSVFAANGRSKTVGE